MKEGHINQIPPKVKRGMLRKHSKCGYFKILLMR